MKTDDDMFVNVPLLHKAVMEEKGFEAISGEQDLVTVPEPINCKI